MRPGRRESLSARVCDGFVLGFAAWTVLCHAMVLQGQGLATLLRFSPLALAAAAAALLACRREWAVPDQTLDDAGDRAGAGAPAPRSRLPILAGSGLLLLGAVLGRADLRLQCAALFLFLAAGLWTTLRGSAREVAFQRPMLPAAAGLLVACSVFLGLAWTRRGQAEDAARLAMVALLAGFFVFLLARRGTGDPGPAHPRRNELALWLVGLCVGAFAWGMGRANFDDVLYVNFAVAAVDDPAAPLLHHDTLHGIPGLPIMFSLYRAASVEVFAAAISFLTKWPAIHVFHWILPALFALLGVLAFGRLLRRIVPSTWLWCLGATLLLFLMGGQGRKSYEAHFWRLQEGKAQYLVAMVPLLIVYAWRFARRPNARTFGLLGAAQIAAVGLTANAVFAAPVVSALSAAAAVPWSWRGARRLLVGLFSSTYVLAVGGFLLLQQPPRLLRTPTASVGRIYRDGEDGVELVRGAWEELFGRGELALIGLLVVCCAFRLARTEFGRRLLVTLPLGLLLFLVNPWVAPLVAHVTGIPTYCRMLWALPVPLLFALVLTAPLAWRRYRIAGLLLSALLLGGYVREAPRRVVGEEVGLHWDPLRLKVTRHYEVAREIVGAVPPGSRVLAPDDVAMWLPTFHDHPYPVVCRNYYLQFLWRWLGKPECTRRKELVDCVAGNLPGVTLPLLAEGLTDYSLDAVCFVDRVPDVTDVRRHLRRNGFRPAVKRTPYEVWVRREALAAVERPGVVAVADGAGRRGR